MRGREEAATAPISVDEALRASETWEAPAEEKPQLFVTIPPMELVFWSLFSAGGMVTAFLIPVHVAILGIAFAAGWLPDEALSYRQVVEFAGHPVAKLYLALLVILPLYHWAHRFRYAIHHQLGIHGGRGIVAILCYGTAVLGTVLTVWVLLRI